MLNAFRCEQIYSLSLYNIQRKLAGQPLFPVSNVLTCTVPLWFLSGRYIPAGDTNQVTDGKTSPAWARQVTVGPEGRRGVIIPHDKA